MTATLEEAIQTINLVKELTIAAPIEITFESILAEMGPESEKPDGKGGSQPFPMVLEARPGGRWFRDLGNNSGHLWGHVQVIKPPTLIEICGPLFMSYPASNFVQYRLTAEGAQTRLTLTHRAMGFIPADHREGVHKGWEFGLNKIRKLAQARAQARSH